MHDLTRDLAARLGGGEVVCHHDPGPNNAVFRAGLPVAFIDFDFAAVGDPLSDVAYLAWSWCVSSRPDRGPAAEQARQVRLLADAYGLSAGQRRRLPDAVDERFLRNEAFWRERADEVVAWTHREAAYFAANRAVFAGALDRG